MENFEAQIDRQADLPPDVDLDRIKLIVKTGITQGLKKEEFLDLLDLLETRYIRKPPLYTPGAPRGWNAYRGGQADVVKFLRNTCGEIKFK